MLYAREGGRAHPRGHDRGVRREAPKRNKPKNTCIYIYIYIERERDIHMYTHIPISLSLSMYIYIYIHAYTYIQVASRTYNAEVRREAPRGRQALRDLPREAERLPPGDHNDDNAYYYYYYYYYYY